MYKLAFFVPDTHAEAVKEAVFATGAGAIGDYDRCCFTTQGIGQFRPSAEANPFLGRMGETEYVSEQRIEMVCADALIHQAIAALKQAHPYEEVAYDVFPLADL